MTAVTFPVQSSAEASADTTPAPCGTIPSIAQAYSLNLTVVPVAGGPVDYISMWPSGYSQPFVATLNDPQGAIVANAAIVPAGTVNGGISVYNQGPANANVIIDMNGFFAAPSDLNGNTAIGSGALVSNTTGEFNTASGGNALTSNTTGSENTASGSGALYSNTTGSNNTATGFGTMSHNTVGIDNTGFGSGALALNTAGNDNTANGSGALFNNTTGNNNTAVGQTALQANTTGASNTALGQAALLVNTTGYANTASGQNAMANNTTGNANTAAGQAAMLLTPPEASIRLLAAYALQTNTTGGSNTALGQDALVGNTTGSGNIAVGQAAASNVSGSNGNNIHIGSAGASGDSGVIRIGATQTNTYIAGIYGGTPGSPNLQVCVDASGMLGTTGCSTPSSRRFKEQITDMGDSSSKLLQLRPVTFLYKPEYDDGSHALQYGLIAEEVADIYPDMVGYDKDGQPASVKYQSLTPMLLNEVQKQNAQLQNQNAQLQDQKAELQNQVRLQQEENRTLEDRLSALELLRSSETSTTSRPASSQ